MYENKKRRVSIKTSKKNYWPLICLILIAALIATALSSRTGRNWMNLFMGIFLCQFAMLKIMRPRQFASGFAMYDIIAQRIHAYGLLYPWIELALGLAYLAAFELFAVWILTIVVFGIGCFSVIFALKKGLNIRCPCMGTLLDVPLSTVTLAENLTMVLMAAWKLVG